MIKLSKIILLILYIGSTSILTHAHGTFFNKGVQEKNNSTITKIYICTAHYEQDSNNCMNHCLQNKNQQEIDTITTKNNKETPKSIKINTLIKDKTSQKYSIYNTQYSKQTIGNYIFTLNIGYTGQKIKLLI